MHSNTEDMLDRIHAGAYAHIPYNVEQTSSNGQMSSSVEGWEVTYPAMCNGRLTDLGYVASTGYGGSDFVHFDSHGEPYGCHLTKKARARLKAMRRDFYVLLGRGELVTE